MSDDEHRLLRLLGQPPARLTAEEVACVLSCHQDDVPVLVAAKLLKPLGNPVQNSTKFFATKKILELAKDEKWLHRMTLVLSQHWRERNARKKAHTQTGSALMPAAADG